MDKIESKRIKKQCDFNNILLYRYYIREDKKKIVIKMEYNVSTFPLNLGELLLVG